MQSKADIIIAVQNLDKFLKIPELSGATVKLNSNGAPYVFTGGFTMVFQLTKEFTKWAFRVWHSGLTQQKERFKKISQYIEKENLSYFEDIIYDEKGLLVNGELVDTIRMKWLEGDLLKKYIVKNIDNFEILQLLADSFLEMFDLLHKHNISHGDLQHGNILIDENHNIRLIDYDSVCVPDIEGNEELVTGLKGYQHPSRLKNASKASIKADYFSELVIYLTLCAIAENPNLWNKYDGNNTEVLLFNESDFENIQHSDIYKELSNSESKTIQSLLKILAEYLNEDSYLNLEPFTKHKDYIEWDIELPVPVANCSCCGKQITHSMSYSICYKCHLEKISLQISEEKTFKHEIENLKKTINEKESEIENLGKAIKKKSRTKGISQSLAVLIFLFFISVIININLRIQNTNLKNLTSSLEKNVNDYISNIKIIESQKTTYEEKIRAYESQLPQVYRTKYANQLVYFKCGNGNWEQLNCLFQDKGTSIYIFGEKDGYGLTHIGGWIPMNRLEKQ